MKCPRKRTLLMLLLLLTGGAIINVAVAWGCALWEPERSTGIVDITNTVPAIFAGQGVLLEANDFLSGYLNKGRGLTFTSAVVETEPTQIYILTEAGWPLRCLAGVTLVTEPLNGSPHAAFYHAWEISPSLRARNKLMPELAFVFPLRPLWPGFAINTIFHAAILWLLFASAGFVRRRIRARRGQCPACAYPIGSSNVCTECGRAVTPRA